MLLFFSTIRKSIYSKLGAFIGNNESAEFAMLWILYYSLEYKLLLICFLQRKRPLSLSFVQHAFRCLDVMRTSFE